MGAPVESFLRVLVLDDQPTEANLVRDLLIANEYDVLVQYDSIKALEHLEAHGQDYDLLVIDVNMPALDGVTLVKRIRAKGINTPVIFISGGIQNGVKRSIQGMGPTVDVLIKPVESQTLVERCVSLVSKSQLYVQMGEVKQMALSIREKMMTPQDVSQVVEKKLETHCSARMDICRKLFDDNLDSSKTFSRGLLKNFKLEELPEAIGPEAIVGRFSKSRLVQALLVLTLFILGSASYLIWDNYRTTYEVRSEMNAVKTDIKHISDNIGQQTQQIDRLVVRIDSLPSMRAATGVYHAAP